jgi:uncharacterized protein (TIGR02569 family)
MRDPLAALLDPRSVAVVGASAAPLKRGHQTIRQLLADGFPHPIHPVNPTAGEILGLRAYPTVEAIDGPVDLAFVATPENVSPSEMRHRCASVPGFPKSVLDAIAPQGLAALCGSSPDVGVVGYTLGGGMGPVARTFGFAADHVESIEVVTPDGRQVVGGWMAYRVDPVDPENGGGRPHPDDLVLVSVKLHQALAGVEPPSFIAQRDDSLARADRAAWGEEEVELDQSRGGRWFELLAGSAKPAPVPNQLAHGDLYRSVRLGSDGIPTVIDFRPFHRPAEWASALVVVDAIVAGDAGAGLIDRWSHLPGWPQMLLRAMLFRLAAHALAPRAPEAELEGLRRAAGLVSEAI